MRHVRRGASDPEARSVLTWLGPASPFARNSSAETVEALETTRIHSIARAYEARFITDVSPNGASHRGLWP
jgi:hypothetical protein